MDLIDFLIEAKKRTYASDGEGGERRLDDGSKELTFELGEFRYRDRYFGFDPFSGEEVVWENGESIWVMNYYGGLISDQLSGKQVYGFLKKAMMKIDRDRYFRGPEHFRDGDLEYTDKSYGNIEDFLGVEEISFKGEVIYRLNYHGGIVRKRV
jgi:hypothetical protein